MSSLYVWYLANQCTKESSARSLINFGKTPSRVTECHIDVFKAYYILEVDESLATTLAVLLYDSFKSANNDLRSLPPSKDTFHQHLLSACYQAWYLWQQSFEEINFPDPKEWESKLYPYTKLFQPLWQIQTFWQKKLIHPLPHASIILFLPKVIWIWVHPIPILTIYWTWIKKWSKWCWLQLNNQSEKRIDDKNI